MYAKRTTLKKVISNEEGKWCKIVVAQPAKMSVWWMLPEVPGLTGKGSQGQCEGDSTLRIPYPSPVSANLEILSEIKTAYGRTMLTFSGWEIFTFRVTFVSCHGALE